MKSLLCHFVLVFSLISSGHAVNIAGSGTGLLGSNDATINDAGTSHFTTGTLANIRDGNLTTRVDNYQTNQTANVNGFVGISWAAARPEAITSLTLTMAHFVDGGWFGNRESPRSGFPLTPEMLVPPVVQVSANLTTWTTVPSTSNYVSAFSGQPIAENSTPASRTFTISLAQKQIGVRGIRIIGPTGGWGDGNGFIGVFELAVEADTLTDSDSDGMDDAWETANGLSVGTNDAALDADSDSLTNGQEFRWSTNPQLADTDGDALNDGAETAIHGSFPNAADTDADGLSDGAEVNTHLTNPALPDTDSDGLGDAAEINIHLTLPGNRDTDGDGFSDGVEITLGTNPLNAASRSPNIARAGQGLIGRNASTSAANMAVAGTARANANTTASITDGDLYSRSDTSGMSGTVSHAGVLWPAAWAQPVARMEVTFATFADGGWFSTTALSPLPGAALTASHLNVTPTLHTTTDGVTWTTIPVADYTTDYVTRLTGHAIGGGVRPVATRRAAVFTLNTPATGIRGIRIAGQHRNYLGIYEVAVFDSSTVGDLDGDGLSNPDEINVGTSPLYSDTDEDTALDGAEVNTLLTNPLLADHDGDLYPDGLEVLRGTDPKATISNPQNLSLLGGGIIGVSSTLTTAHGTDVADAGVPGNLTDGDNRTRVGTFNSSNEYSFAGAIWDAPMKVAALKVQFATFADGGWFGQKNLVPAVGGQLTAAHLIEPSIQVSFDKGVTWLGVAHTSDYIVSLTGHAIAGADTRPTRTPVATFTLVTPATGITGMRLIGLEGGGANPFVNLWDLIAVPSTAALETSVTIPWVPVGNVGNPAHSSGIGAVAYQYSISKYEITLAQYCAFLNAVAASDPNGLYDPAMATNGNVRGISRQGVSGSYNYHVMGDGTRPVTLVSWKDAARFANWIQNGQGNGSTETGAYDLSLPSNLSTAQVRQPGTTIALPTHDEWYKAGFYDPAKNGGAGGYWTYAFRSDTLVNNTESANYFDLDYAVSGEGFLSGNVLWPVGHYADRPSAYGTFDQTGSLAEYVEALESISTATLRRYVGGNYATGAGASSREPLKGLEPSLQGADQNIGTCGFRIVQVPATPVLFAGSPPSGLVTTWVGGNDGGGGNGSFGAGYFPNNTTSYIPDTALLQAPLWAASSEGLFSNSNPALPHNSSAKGTVGLGKLNFNVAQFAHNASFFSSIASGGWEETFLINSPGLAGTPGWLLCKLSLDAHFHVGEPAGASNFRFEVRTDGPAFTGSEPGKITGSSQSPYPSFLWGHAYYPIPVTPLIKDVVEDIVVSVPIIFGQQIRLKAYGIATAGFRALGSYPPMSSAAYVKLNWTGIQGVINAGGQSFPDVTINTVSGTPWSIQIPPQQLPVKNVAMTPMNGGYQLTWPSWPGEIYLPQTSEDLTNWIPQPALPAAIGNSMSFQWNPPPSQMRGFLRVLQEF